MILPIEVEAFTNNLQKKLLKQYEDHNNVTSDLNNKITDFISEKDNTKLIEASKKLIRHENLYGLIDIPRERSITQSLLLFLEKIIRTKYKNINELQSNNE